MASPRITVSIRDPGLGLVRAADNKFIYFGCSSKGTVNSIVPVTTPAAVEDTFGDGPLAEALAYGLSVAGGPQWGCRLTGTVVGAAGAVTATRVSTSTGLITVAGAAFDAYEVVVEIMASGTVAVATFRFSLDGGDTWSATITVPSGGTYAIARTNLTLTFVPGAGPIMFERGDKHAFTSTAPHYSSTELALGMDAILPFVSLQPDIDIDAVVFTGKSMRIFPGETPALHTNRPSSNAASTIACTTAPEPSNGTNACIAPSPECAPTARGIRRRNASNRRTTRSPSTAIRPSAPR